MCVLAIRSERTSGSFLRDSGLGFRVFVKLPQLAGSLSPFGALVSSPQDNLSLPSASVPMLPSIPQLFSLRIQTLFFLVSKFFSFFTKSISLNTNSIKILFSIKITHKHFRPTPCCSHIPYPFSPIQPLLEHVYFSPHMFHPCVK